MTVGRILICNTCRRDWDVIEIPTEFIDHRTYVCADCLQPRTTQLNLDETERTETRRYDPDTAPFPEGF